MRDVTDMSLPAPSVLFISPVLPCIGEGWVSIHTYELTEFSVLVMCNLQLVSAYEDSNTYTQCTGMIDVFKSCALA